MRIILLFAVVFTAQLLFAQNYKIKGLEKEVEIIIDTWGIPHIYAETERDLFFAQGWNAARDRLFQFEIWRRQSTGTTAEILGPSELKRDIGTRLFMFRGDIEDEMNHYHERGSTIITAFTDGVNAYIDYILEHEDELPLEFKLLGIKPQKWTPEVVISRHQGLLGNIGNELSIARQVSVFGMEKTKEFNYFHPQDPDLLLDESIDPKWLEDDILEIYNAFRRPVRFSKEDLQMGGISDKDASGLVDAAPFNELMDDERSIGSNNWILSGEHTASGFPMMANDPHRSQSVPSLRYMSHLVGPGWNVIGGGEPEIPGISIGHNEYGAWGLTVYSTDAEDLYIYKVNESNRNQYWYKDQWKSFEVITDTIKVKGAPDEIVSLEYTVHGPVTFRNETENIAFAIRCGWLEIGGSPYLASLRMNQAKNFEEFRLACHYSHIPGENMIWADKAGNIGWQAVGIAPIRRNWSGLVPVPGDGSYEWDGYLPILQKPFLFNPESGMFSTANQNVTPMDYKYWEATGYNWADAYRGDRVKEVLQSGRKFTVHDMAALQTDYQSIPARALVPLLQHLLSSESASREALQRLANWDDGYELSVNSIEAAIYVEWENVLRDKTIEKLLPEDEDGLMSMPLTKVIERLAFPDGNFGSDPMKGRDEFLISCFDEAVKDLENRLGKDQSKWQYGQEKNKHIKLFHPLGRIVSSELQEKLNVGPHPRGGYGYTVGSTSNNYNQASGASFKVIIDTGNWDHALFTNNPGQSGNPDSPFYNNLFDYWAKDKYFPMFYSEDKIKSTEAQRVVLSPDKAN